MRMTGGEESRASEASGRLNVMVRLDSGARPLRHRARVRVLRAAQEVSARLLLWDAAAVEPGGDAPAQLRPDAPLAARRGEALTLGAHGAPDVLGTATVLETEAPPFRDRDPATAARLRALSSGDATGIARQSLGAAAPRPLTAEALAANAGLTESVAREALESLARAGAARETPAGFVDAVALDALRRRWLERVAAVHRRFPLRPGIPRSELRARELPSAIFDAILSTLAADGEFVVQGDAVRLPDFSVRLRPEQEDTAREILDLYRNGSWRPPWEGEVTRALGPHRATRDLWESLAATERLIALGDGLYLHPDAAAEGLAALRALFRDSGSVSVAAFRDAVSASRKVVVPFLEWCDARGFTRRADDSRLPGDRMPSAGAKAEAGPEP